jgi:hypothetical protein
MELSGLKGVGSGNGGAGSSKSGCMVFLKVPKLSLISNLPQCTIGNPLRRWPLIWTQSSLALTSRCPKAYCANLLVASGHLSFQMQNLWCSPFQMMVLQEGVSGEQRCHKWFQQGLYCQVCKSLPQFLIDWVLWGTHFSCVSPRFLLGHLKYASLGIGQILEVGVRWYLPPFVVGVSSYDVCFLVSTVFTHFLTLWWFTPLSLSSLISWPSSNICNLIYKQVAMVE